LKRTGITAILIAFVAAAVITVTGCGSRPTLANLSAEELFEYGKEEYYDRDYLRALEYFQAIVYNYPGASVVDSAQYFLALSYFGTEEYELAQVEFNRLVLNYPSSVYFEHSIFMKAVSFFEGTPKHYGLDQADLREAITLFEDFIIDYPESELVPQAQEYLLTARTRLAKKFYNSAVVYNRMGAYQAAEIYYRKVVDDYTDTEFAPEATFHLAEMAYKQRRYDDARKRFEGFLVVFPDHELAGKARKSAAEASFKSGQKAFDGGDYQGAREYLQTFVESYSKHSKAKKARELLMEIDSLVPPDNKGEDASS
jgi:outer membrane protein assembly factor BamD